MKKVAFQTIVFDSDMNPVVLLIDENQEFVLPLFFTPKELEPILFSLENFIPEQPETYNLLLEIIKTNNLKVKELTITDIFADRVFSVLALKKGRKEQFYNCRINDGLALAIYFKAPIYITEKVELSTYPVTSLPDDLEKELQPLIEEWKKSLN
ncbi:bifunctional nuclease family protein [Carboxydothermus hydrogenoformans]|uniref:BFN domain-containing protein n=1 Tax=Carboxydothermus hydrogenoformans (strain ATCC BAA-161 / DSM 6008 / Z-2901) TaxID=246194 RepID=Q3ABZ8_CARHZ|nr:bifunctional nuclease domain-containing protein [Carboxydothermus hydrogenoformans]ABB15141.1 conserved hypothetical protein [Carboxydothermus hydrogenoformans Z-2901]